MAVLLVLKASLVLAIVLGAAALLRKTAAVTRHGVWSLGFCVLLVLPLLSPLLPGIDVRLPAGWYASLAPAGVRVSVDPAPLRHATLPAGPLQESGAPPATGRADVSHPRGTGRFGVAGLLVAVWTLGSVAAVSMLLLSLVRVRRLAARATELTDPDWLEAAERLRQRVGLRRRVRLVVSERVHTPMAAGLTRAVVFLPPSAPAWTAERRDVVLAHELAHLAGADPLRHVAARLAVALYWFHPLAWLAARQSTVAREQACDETVLALGTRPSSYARVLLDFAECGSAPLGALPIAERSLLETRVMAILAHEPRNTARPRPLIPLAVIAALAIAIAAARPAAPLSAVQISAALPVAAGLQMDIPPTAPAAAAQPQPVEFDCRSRNDGGRSPIYDQIAVRGADRVITRSTGDLRICMSAAGLPDGPSRPSEWPARASRTVMQSQQGATVHRLEGTRQAGSERVVWRVGGVERAFDANGEEWRARMLALLDASWEHSVLRGEANALRGEMSRIRGQESTLRGRISTLAGELSTMQGRMSTIRGEESTLRGEISAIEGQLSAARGADKRIQEIEARLRALDADAKIAAIEKEMRAFDIEGKVADVDRRIRELDADDTIAAVARMLAQLDEVGRGRMLEEQLERELQRMRELVSRLKRIE
jgi:beta-lactamase regulating signal transducer with metallopeptidase domain